MYAALNENKKIWAFDIDENLSQEKFDLYLKLMKTRKPPPKKSGGATKKSKK
jgi:hypothetical protein